MTANIIYERIKEQADKQNLSLRQLSIKSGFKSPSAISRYKQGVTPTDTAVKAIAGALGVSVDYLLGNTDDMHANKKSTAKDTVDVEKDPTILSLDGIEITDEYRQFIIDQIRTIRKMRGDDK